MSPLKPLSPSPPDSMFITYPMPHLKPPYLPLPLGSMLINYPIPHLKPPSHPPPRFNVHYRLTCSTRRYSYFCGSGLLS